MSFHSFFVYITTNPNKTTLYVGITNALTQRLIKHYLTRGKPKTFAGRYFCYNLIYFEEYQYVEKAISREKQIKGWNRKKKEALISGTNPKWKFLNREIMDWPPQVDVYSRS